MYILVESEHVIRIPPHRLGEDLDEVIESLAYETIEGRVESFPREQVRDPVERKYLIVMILSWEKVGEGVIIHGDGAVYQKVRYTALAFHPRLHEVVDGSVVSVLKFGAFVRFGPLDGLLHISQIMDDRIDVDLDNQRCIGKDTKRVLKKGDKLRARIVALSINDVDPRKSKIGLTMKQPGLGKWEWLKETGGGAS